MTSSLPTGKLPEGMLKGTTGTTNTKPAFVEATHMMMVAERCQKQGIYFAAVPWCFLGRSKDAQKPGDSRVILVGPW